MTAISIDKIIHCRFNTRKTRTPESVERLSDRIKRNGYEKTRAIWVYSSGDNYCVFAGGTRFEAAKMAGLKTIPAIVYENSSNDEISRLADIDNENDECHVPVPIVDVWAEYARLHEEEGWNQEKIAKVKDVTHPMVIHRIRLHKLSDKIKGFVNQNNLQRLIR